MKIAHILHLYNRASFGITPSRLSGMEALSRKQIVDDLFKASATPRPIEMDLTIFEPLLEKGYRSLKGARRKELNKRAREKTRELNALWIDRMTGASDALRERMTLFWANVFVCRENSVWFALKYNNTLRSHALGNFRDMAKAVSREPAMMKYLNLNQNVKGSPNENFARELMELFTLGTGHYSENDIRESARAFTGYAFQRNGDFYIRPRKHDEGTKEFFDNTGNFDGDDILDMIVQKEQCAHFICDKLYREFVNPTVNQKQLDEITAVFYEGYDIKNVLRHIFMADWFYDEGNMGSRIKSPVELLVGIKKTVPVQFEKTKQLLFVQKIMGQVLLYPPNVAGWKGDKSWIDANSLVFRLNLPASLFNGAVINYAEKGEFEDSFEAYYKKKKNRKTALKTQVSWEAFDGEYGKLSRRELKQFLLAPKIDGDTAAYLDNLEDQGNREFCLQLMSLPEYQLC
ncbi:MAG: hypothetical protein CL868_16570 [Cytophagaceae bacterium]|nr:hypothetical protein [Cytophagaceae bacterium]